jgi:ribosomal protein S18 acetylase RimI-like enzyme
MTITIVDGVKVPSDDHLADLLWETDPEIFRFIFRDLQVWRRLFPQEWTAAFGTQQAVETRVALDGNRVVGLVNSFSGSEVAPRFVTTMERQLSALDPDAGRQLTAAFDAMEWLYPQVPDHALFVLNLVVAADMRGQDLGRLLIAEAVAKARRSGLRAVHLDTAADNPAVRFYQRVGFRAVVESRAMSLPDGVALPNHLRMVLDIGA